MMRSRLRGLGLNTARLRKPIVKFTRELPTSIMIRSVSEKGLHIGADVHGQPVALTNEAVIGDWADKPVDELVEDDFRALLDTEPELIILGTGDSIEFAPREITFAFARRGIGLEVMDTRAAARTFNVLAGEGRRIAAVMYV